MASDVFSYRKYIHASIYMLLFIFAAQYRLAATAGPDAFVLDSKTLPFAPPGHSSNSMGLNVDAGAIPEIHVNDLSANRGWLGVTLVDSAVFPAIAAGPTVRAVVPATPARMAGLTRGDTILRVGCKRTDSVRELVRVIALERVGAPVIFTIFHNGAVQCVGGLVGNRGLAEDRMKMKFMNNGLFLEAGRIGPTLEPRFFVAQIRPQSRASRTGFRRGMRLISIDARKISTPRNVAELFTDFRSSRSIYSRAHSIEIEWAGSVFLLNLAP